VTIGIAGSGILAVSEGVGSYGYCDYARFWYYRALGFTFGLIIMLFWANTSINIIFVLATVLWWLLLVPSQQSAVNPVRPGREQRQQWIWVPGCGW